MTSSDLATDAALGRAEEIRAALAALVEGRAQVLDLIQQARDGEDHLALGYPSWTAYVSGEFGNILPKLTQAERAPLASRLRELGMSTRAIAPVLGVHHDTVADDLRRVGNPTPDGRAIREPDSPVIGMDGKTYAPRPVPAPHPPTLPPPREQQAEQRRRAAWQPFRALMSSTVAELVDHVEDLIAGHEWADLDDTHRRHGIDSRGVVLDRVRALRDAADRLLTAWDEEPPATLRRIK